MPRAPTPAERKIAERKIANHVAGHVRYSGMSERQIAKEANWHIKRVQRLLTGETKISALDIQTIAHVLRKPVGDLFPDWNSRRAA